VEDSRTIQNFLESSYGDPSLADLLFILITLSIGNVLINAQIIEIIAKIDRAANHNGLHKKMCH
jgi:hypothetical protein